MTRTKEAQGQVRWLRPDYQNPGGRAAAAQQLASDLGESPAAAQQPRLSATMPERFRAIRSELLLAPAPASRDEIARPFKGARQATIEELLVGNDP